MSEHIPAWKRIGLKVKETLEVDPLAITAHLDSAKVTKKQVKQLNKRKSVQESENAEKKPPKRVKLAKNERPPPPEKDQLAYLKTYSTDRDNWKFSKQKQNWILKHIKTIEAKYEEYLVNYLEGLQGGSRDRVVEEMRKVVESWNTAARETSVEEKPKDKCVNTEKDEDTDDEMEGEEAKKEAEKQLDAKKEETLESVDSDYASRAKKIIETITGETIELDGIEEEKNKEVGEQKDSSDSEQSQKSIVSDEESSSDKAEEVQNRVESSANLDNLIIEQVEVNDFVTHEDALDEPQASKTEPAEPSSSEDVKKSKKSKKKSKKDNKKYKKTKKEKKESGEE